jgi:hypothetical protein
MNTCASAPAIPAAAAATSLLLLHQFLRQGLDKMFTGLDPSKMASGIASAQQGGLDAARLLERFHASPSLSQRMTNPRVLAALMDMAR